MRSSPSPVNFLDDGTLLLRLGKGSGKGTGPGPPAPSPWSDMSFESLLLLELSGSPAGTPTGVLLGNPFCGDSGNPLGVPLAAFASSVADSAESRWALSLASCLAASSIENCSFVGALTNPPCSSLARFSNFFLGGLLPLGTWWSSILITC